MFFQMRGGDLKKMPITKNNSAEFAQVTRSAWDILADRDNAELHEIADTIDWLLYEPPEDNDIVPELPDTTAKELYKELNDYNYSDNDYKLYEYFAVLALLYVSEESMFAMFINDPDEIIERLGSNVYYWSSGARLSQASGAIAYAEMILNYEQNLNDIAQKKISLKAQKSAIKRHAEAKSIKTEFIKYCQDHDGVMSNSEMARRFYEQLDKESARKIAPSNKKENAVRTLTEALRNYNKTL